MHQLLELLGKRMKVADQIGALKKDKNVAVLQSKRWNEILRKYDFRRRKQRFK